MAKRRQSICIISLHSAPESAYTTAYAFLTVLFIKTNGYLVAQRNGKKLVLSRQDLKKAEDTRVMSYKCGLLIREMLVSTILDMKK